MTQTRPSGESAVHFYNRMTEKECHEKAMKENVSVHYGPPTTALFVLGLIFVGISFYALGFHDISDWSIIVSFCFLCFLGVLGIAGKFVWWYAIRFGK